MADVLPQYLLPKRLRVKVRVWVRGTVRIEVSVGGRVKVEHIWGGGSGAGRRDNLFRFYWVFFQNSTKQKKQIIIVFSSKV